MLLTVPGTVVLCIRSFIWTDVQGSIGPSWYIRQFSGTQDSSRSHPLSLTKLWLLNDVFFTQAIILSQECIPRFNWQNNVFANIICRYTSKAFWLEIAPARKCKSDLLGVWRATFSAHHSGWTRPLFSRLVENEVILEGSDHSPENLFWSLANDWSVQTRLDFPFPPSQTSPELYLLFIITLAVRLLYSPSSLNRVSFSKYFCFDVQSMLSVKTLHEDPVSWLWNWPTFYGFCLEVDPSL